MPQGPGSESCSLQVHKLFQISLKEEGMRTEATSIMRQLETHKIFPQEHENHCKKVSQKFKMQLCVDKKFLLGKTFFSTRNQLRGKTIPIVLQTWEMKQNEVIVVESTDLGGRHSQSNCQSNSTEKRQRFSRRSIILQSTQQLWFLNDSIDKDAHHN